MINNTKKIVLKIRNNELTPKVLAEAMKKALGSSNTNINIQTVKQLTKQGKDFKDIPIANTSIKGLEKIAMKFDVEYTIIKSTKVDEWQVYFKARQNGDIANAFRAYISKVAEDEQNPIKSLFGEGGQMEQAQKRADEYNKRNRKNRSR